MNSGEEKSYQAGPFGFFTYSFLLWNILGSVLIQNLFQGFFLSWNSVKLKQQPWLEQSLFPEIVWLDLETEENFLSMETLSSKLNVGRDLSDELTETSLTED